MAVYDFTNGKAFKDNSHLPPPTNEGLANLFIDVDKVIIKNGGVDEDKAISDEVVLVISQMEQVQKLNTLLQVDEQDTGFYCMCLGTYAIELHSNNQIKATIGYHHGVSIRYHNWDGDAELVNSDGLLNFLAEQGLTKPLNDRIKVKKEMEAARIKTRELLDIAPKCFEKYWQQICRMENTYLKPLIKDLNIEIPDKNKQITILLRTYGITESLWSAFPVYELAPNDILKTFEIEKIIKAYLNSERDYTIRRGLGRYLCRWDSPKQQKKQLKFIPMEVIDDLEQYFNSIDDKQGINKVLSLRHEKTIANSQAEQTWWQKLLASNKPQ